MSIIYQNTKNLDVLKDACICFGIFDGLHEGHIFEINQTIKDAQENNKKSVCVTFDIDPDEIFVKDFIKVLDNKSRMLKLSQTNIDIVYVIDFKSIMNLEANEFLDKFFLENLPFSMHVGRGFRFGTKQSGDTEVLEKWGKTHKMNVYIHDLLTKGGRVISSTYLRKQIKESREQE